MSKLKDMFKPQKVELPKSQPVTPMPDPESASVREAGRLATQQAMQRGGRRSTILSGGRGGYDTYSSARTGAA